MYQDLNRCRGPFRNQGFGKKLLSLCEQWLKEQGITCSLLHAAQKATSFYKLQNYDDNREFFKWL